MKVFLLLSGDVTTLDLHVNAVTQTMLPQRHWSGKSYEMMPDVSSGVKEDLVQLISSVEEILKQPWTSEVRHSVMEA